MIIDDVLSSQKPTLMMLTHGSSVASDINKELKRAEQSGLSVVRINIDENPDIGEQFSVGKHAVLVTLNGGEVVARRSRPWATDAGEMVNAALILLREAGNANGNEAAPPPPVANASDKPVNVTDATFEQEVLQSELPVLVDFWAEWCGPCRTVAPILDKLAVEFQGRIKIAKVDVDANPMLSQGFRIQSIPTMMFVKNGKIVGQQAGAAPEAALRDVIRQLEELEVPAD